MAETGSVGIFRHRCREKFSQVCEVAALGRRWNRVEPWKKVKSVDRDMVQGSW